MYSFYSKVIFVEFVSIGMCDYRMPYTAHFKKAIYVDLCALTSMILYQSGDSKKMRNYRLYSAYPMHCV